MKVTLPASFPRCRICKKPLKNSASQTKGIGPECAAKWAWMLCDAGLTLESLGIPESISIDPLVALHLGRAEKALLAGRKSDVERFKAAAIEAARESAQRVEREALAEAAWNEEMQYEYGRFVQAAA